ncbi:conserved protein of unknown function [Cupriavidus taiwanensis]|uniref:hypothetical protein n=1 Tax=Cupriavidus taiwanensis TaxID=164546 RepID=UPI000E109AE1|nr:hypothetical protein [Cupriavidus taiwanensis]SPA41158.1 conserved protein of unknown function [Cupriavidus taiwanensis]
MTTCSSASAAAWGRQPGSSELLHRIRASVARIRMDGANGAGIERRLSSLLRHALAAGSPFEIALVLGSAAELMLFPEAEVLEQCTAAVKKADQQALRGLVWAVRHRSMRGGKDARRFTLDPQ